MNLERDRRVLCETAVRGAPGAGELPWSARRPAGWLAGLGGGLLKRRGLGARLLTLWILWGALWPVAADEVHQPVVYEGRVGPYQARVVVRPPGVIPGLAQISVRVVSGQAFEVSALPIKWNVGKKGAPPADVARPVRGDEGLFFTQLWFMESGPHGVEVMLRGAEGEGRILVPVNAIATRVMGVPRLLGMLLAGLGAVLVALLVSIAGAAVRESVLAAGEVPSRRRLWAARGTMTAAAFGVAGLLWGGWTWWDAEARAYRNNRLYRPRSTELTLLPDGGGNRLRFELDEPHPHRVVPLVPDHGRLMHVFLVREPDLDAMAHLHPERKTRRVFETSLPSLPGGEYAVYAQITLETGLSETLTNRLVLPSISAGSVSVAALDPEDGWVRSATVSKGASDLGDGLRMVRMDGVEGRVGVEMPVSLRFRVEDSAGRAVRLEPYLGMRAHMALRSRDGRIFSHVHPTGSFSMAAQQLLVLREAGGAPRTVNYGADDPVCRLPGVEASMPEWLAQGLDSEQGEVSFPYEFIRPGGYRIWVQVRVMGVIRTGVFDVDAGFER